jgi:hypothetical protein
MAAAYSQGVEQADPATQVALAEANQWLQELRRARNEFHDARILTKQAQTGRIPCRYPPDQLAAHVRGMRDARAEQEAVTNLRDLLTYMNQRDPTADEMEAGPPESLGAIWLAPAIIAGVTGGAWTLSNLFSYLAERERRIQEAAGIRPPSMLRSVARVVVPVVAVAAVGGGGYWLWKRRKKAVAAELAETKVSSRAKTKVMQQNPEPKALPPPPEDDDDDGEEDEE